MLRAGRRTGRAMPTDRPIKGLFIVPDRLRRYRDVMPKLLRVERSPTLRERVRLAWLGGVALCIVIAVEGGFLLHQDATRIRPAADPAKGGQVLAGEGVTAAAAAPEVPKVALMFLSRGPMPLEPVWEAFLSAAAALAQPRGAEAAGGRSSTIRRGLSQQAAFLEGETAPSAAEAPSLGRRAWEVLFSLYIHPPPDFAYPPGSIFSGHEVPGRVAVQWGQHSVVEAERALLRAALADPLNQRFVLLSDSCIPLYPPATVFWQLMSEMRSRVNACKDDSDPNNGRQRMDYRWHPNMLAAHISKEQWRKGSQWTMLLRKHAELVANDSSVNAVFSKECWADMKPPVHRFCVSDEHYVPTLLAHLGLERECECGGQVTHVHWDGPYFHPKTYGREEASNSTLAWLRGQGCDWSEAKAARARGAIASVLEQLQGQVAKPDNSGADGSSSSGGGGGGSSRNADSASLGGGGTGVVAGRQEALRETFRLLAQRAAVLDGALLEARCPLFARKIAGNAAQEWGQVLQPVVRQRLRL